MRVFSGSRNADSTVVAGLIAWSILIVLALILLLI